MAFNDDNFMLQGEPEELVGGVFFLASEELSSFVNGVVLPIDGGFNAYSGV